MSEPWKPGDRAILDGCVKCVVLKSNEIGVNVTYEVKNSALVADYRLTRPPQETPPVADQGNFNGVTLERLARLDATVATLIDRVESLEQRLPAPEPVAEPEVKPLPCPFCGTDNDRIRIGRDGDGGFTVVCRDCELDGPNRKTESGAIVAWNQRAPLKPSETAPTFRGMSRPDNAGEWRKNP